MVHSIMRSIKKILILINQFKNLTREQNIFELIRKTADANNNAIPMDDLTYAYKNGNTNSNLLTNVSDAVSKPDGADLQSVPFLLKTLRN